MELIKFMFLFFFFFWLLPWLLFYNIHIVFFKPFGDWMFLSLYSLVLNCSNLVMSYQFCVLFLRNCEIMVVQPPFVSNLLRDKLSMVSSWDALIDDLLLVWTFKEVGVHELGHFNVVCEDVKRDFFAFSNCHKLIFLLILLICFTFCHEKVFIFCESTSLEGCDRLNDLTELFIKGNRP